MKLTLTTALAALATALPVAALADGAARMSFDDALACVQRVVPASSYTTNDLIPDPAHLVPDAPLPQTVHLRVGMPWVLNDEEAPFYNAIANGYYAAEGLDVELVAGGPGRNHIQTLAGGAVDIAVHASGIYIPQALTSPTPIENIVAVGSILRGAPAVLLTIDPELQGRDLTPADLQGRVVAGAPFLQYMPIMMDRAGLPVDSVEVIPAGFTPDILYAHGADFYLGWVFNQTRDIEAHGLQWNGIMWRDFAFDNYTDVVIMNRSMLDDPAQHDVAARFMRATYRGLQFLLDEPQRSAEIAVQHAVDAPNLTVDQALFRFERQRFLITGEDESQPLMQMDPAFWDDNTAILAQYGFMDTLNCQ
ncbi:MAG: ABC transporter substrate-binding protein [Rhodobacteraceae bacterium]|nr:ABC transporter substrate-binding protein [Paracoccaceae bacterium]